MPRFRRRAQGGEPAPHVHTASPYGPDWDVPARFNFTRDVVEGLARDPARRALTFVDNEGIVERFTFEDVARRAAGWAETFRHAGLVPGDRVLVLLGRRPEWHTVLLGCLKAGLVAVPCSDMLRARDLAFRAGHSGARLLVSSPAQASEVEGMLELVPEPIDVLELENETVFLKDAAKDAPTHDTAHDDPAFILYTSGTTKEPKGVVHTHAYTFATRRQAESWLDVRPGDLVWCTAGTGWAKSIWNVLLGPWSVGAEIVMHERPFDPEERLELVERLGVTVLCQAPTEYRLMAKLDGLELYDLGRLRHAVSAGEPLNPEVIAVFRETFGLTICDGFGQTENSLLVANLPGAEIRPGSMGLPTPGHRVAVVDGKGNAVAPGVEGEIALHGSPPTLFRGYWQDEAATEACFRGEWYLTGDRAVVDEDGYLWFRGRADDVILSAAYRIGPFEVESALLEHPAVAESAAIGKPDPDRGQIVKAFVVLRPGFEAGDELVAELQEHVKAVTAPYKYPREIAFVEELPKTSSGKIRRVDLRTAEAATAVSRPGARGEPQRAPGKGSKRERRERAKAELLRRAQEQMRAEEEARRESRRRAEEEERREATEREARAQAQVEEQRRAQEAERARAEDEGRRRAEEDARRRAEEDARREAERRAQEQAEREAEARARAVEESRREAEERASLEATALIAKAQAEREAVEREARSRLEAEILRRAQGKARIEEEARIEARRRAEEEARRAAAARAEREAAEQQAREAEALALAEAEARARAQAEEDARREAERREAARREAERVEAERREAARREAERLEAARLEAERLETERREAERREAARREAERLEAERLEAERLQAERRELEKARRRAEEPEEQEVPRPDLDGEATVEVEHEDLLARLSAYGRRPVPHSEDRSRR